MVTLNEVIVGNARELIKSVSDSSVDLCFTDPIYWNIDDYLWLSQECGRALKDSGNLLVYVTQQHLREQLSALSTHMTYSWLFAIQLYGRRAAMWQKKIQACGQLIAWFSKSDNFEHRDWVSDFIGVQARQSEGHHWRKGLAEAEHYIRGFTSAGQVVLDPFCGGGTIPLVAKSMERDFIAFEQDDLVAAKANDRLRCVQPYLLRDVPEQLSYQVE